MDIYATKTRAGESADSLFFPRTKLKSSRISRLRDEDDGGKLAAIYCLRKLRRVIKLAMMTEGAFAPPLLPANQARVNVPFGRDCIVIYNLGTTRELGGTTQG
ncbi:uncharacterized protein LOC103315587 isoform X1 [Nasonia vitripennis]|uniref:Uncharacterized protein n=1 Tax=Nasonia vitripennis TaxID=7425 RepID=A0A7M7QAU9_NASVI|nr:uncharacterized protein LOC103315587 isoform X1 [Nasonia vitripennis]